MSRQPPGASICRGDEASHRSTRPSSTRLLNKKAQSRRCFEFGKEAEGFGNVLTFGALGPATLKGCQHAVSSGQRTQPTRLPTRRLWHCMTLHSCDMPGKQAGSANYLEAIHPVRTCPPNKFIPRMEKETRKMLWSQSNTDYTQTLYE